MGPSCRSAAMIGALLLSSYGSGEATLLMTSEGCIRILSLKSVGDSLLKLFFYPSFLLSSEDSSAWDVI
jgi:hypothetical protein